jgi:hypothetical protein
MNTRILQTLLFGFIFFVNNAILAQDKRAQYPKLLSKAYFGVNMGYINYPFTNAALEPGYSAQSVKVPHLAARILLFGYRFNKNISAQLSYMRPVNWVQYNNVNGDNRSHSVWMNVGGITVKGQVPLTDKFSVFADAGLAIVTRHGFDINNQPGVTNSNYAGVLLSGGLQYQVNSKWDLLLASGWSPANKKEKQPHTFFISGGFNYNMRPLSDEKVKRNSGTTTGNIFPLNLLQVGYTTNSLGYGVNKFFSEGAVPVFWGGNVEVANGFSLQWAANLSYLKTRKYGEHFVGLSLLPVFRFTFVRTTTADLYFNYVLAGPTFLSRVVQDSINTGKRFTFYDAMGIGVFAGRSRKLNAEIKIAHYSNGNIFPRNPGVKIPLSLNVGVSF